MDFLTMLSQRNKEFAAAKFAAGLKMMPTQKTIIIGCIDPRVDPHNIFNLNTGEAVVIRNVGGRVTEATLESVALVGALAKAAGKEIGPGWNLMVLHHTDCGIVGCSHLAPDLLAKNLGVEKANFNAVAIADPYKAVAFDVAMLKADSSLPPGLAITGAVYDVVTGQVETVVPASSTPFSV